MERRNFEQRYATKFSVKLGEGATDTYVKFQKAFDNDAVSRVQVFQWHKNFVNGREMVEVEPRSGRHASVRTSRGVDCLRAFIRQDRRSTIRMIAHELNIN
jgi:hypothetical protein